jgi:hypothetical protein
MVSSPHSPSSLLSYVFLVFFAGRSSLALDILLILLSYFATSFTPWSLHFSLYPFAGITLSKYKSVFPNHNPINRWWALYPHILYFFDI